MTMWAFPYCSEWGLLASCGERASHCGDVSCCRARALEHVGFSSCDSLAVELRLSNRGTWL